MSTAGTTLWGPEGPRPIGSALQQVDLPTQPDTMSPQRLTPRVGSYARLRRSTTAYDSVGSARSSISSSAWRAAGDSRLPWQDTVRRLCSAGYCAGMASAVGSVPLRRILVYGVTGAGKSTAAEQIASRTGLPLTLADELTWEPNWVPVDEAMQRSRIAAVVAGDRWVLDTAYSAWLDIVLPRVDVVVALDYPRWFSLQRLARRSVMRAFDKRPICNGNTESFRLLIHRDSIVAWHFRTFTRKRLRMHAWASSGGRPTVLLFARPRDLNAWIEAL